MNASFDKMAKRAAKAEKRIGGLLSNLGKFKALAAGAGVAIGGRAVIGFLGDSLQESARIEQLGVAMAELEKRSGRVSGSLSAATQKVQAFGVSSRLARDFVFGLSEAGVDLNTIITIAGGGLDAAARSGRGLTDVFQRLTEGISKSEKEILDELRIFIRLDTATQKYANTLGVTVSQLTEYQRT